MTKLNLNHLKSFSLSVLFCVVSTTSVYAAEAERECRQTILFVPQLHNQGTDLARASSFTKRRDEHFKNTIKNQLQIYHFLKGQNSVIPIFYEGYGEAKNEKNSKLPLTPQKYGLSERLTATGFESLTDEEKTVLYNYGATIAMLIYGDRPQIYGVSPSQAEHDAVHEKIKILKEQFNGNEVSIDSELFKTSFLLRDQWAIIEAIKWFKANPKIPYAFMVYGLSHNFRGYEKFLPNGYCISTLGAFDEYYRSVNYEIKSAEVLEVYLKANP